MPHNRSNPTAFSAHAKRINNAGSKGYFHGNPGSKGGRKGRCFVCNKFGHCARERPNRRDTSHDDDHNYSKGSFNNIDQRNGRSNGKGKGIQDIKEMVTPPRNQGTPGMKNQMLLTIRKKSTILYRPSPLPLLCTLWEIGLLIVLPQGTSPDKRNPSLIW